MTRDEILSEIWLALEDQLSDLQPHWPGEWRPLPPPDASETCWLQHTSGATVSILIKPGPVRIVEIGVSLFPYTMAAFATATNCALVASDMIAALCQLSSIKYAPSGDQVYAAQQQWKARQSRMANAQVISVEAAISMADRFLEEE